MTVAELKGLLNLFEDEMEVQIMDGDWAESIDDVDIRDGKVLIQHIG